MIRRPPISTRTDTLCPYTTLFRSARTARGLTLTGMAACPPSRIFDGGHHGSRTPKLCARTAISAPRGARHALVALRHLSLVRPFDGKGAAAEQAVPAHGTYCRLEVGSDLLDRKRGVKGTSGSVCGWYG